MLAVCGESVCLCDLCVSERQELAVCVVSVSVCVTCVSERERKRLGNKSATLVVFSVASFPFLSFWKARQDSTGGGGRLQGAGLQGKAGGPRPPASLQGIVKRDSSLSSS